MSLVEIARFTDVHEAGLARAFLSSQGVDTFLTEYHQTTIDPLMQRALGVRLLGIATVADEGRSLLARVRAGEFADPEPSDLAEAIAPDTRAVGTTLALFLGLAGGFWGVSLPRRLRPVHWAGLSLILTLWAGAPVAALLWLNR